VPDDDLGHQAAAYSARQTDPVAGPPKKPPLVPPDDRTVDTARWYAREGARLGPTKLQERHQTERIQTRCAFCTETFDGTFRDGRA
jgi:hypothetical protein